MKVINSKDDSSMLIRCMERTIEGNKLHPRSSFLYDSSCSVDLASPSSDYFHSSAIGLLSLEDKGRLLFVQAVHNSLYVHVCLDSFTENGYKWKKR